MEEKDHAVSTVDSPRENEKHIEDNIRAYEVVGQRAKPESLAERFFHGLTRCTYTLVANELSAPIPRKKKGEAFTNSISVVTIPPQTVK